MTTNKQMVPELRFKGFTDAWEERKLEELSLVLTGFPFKNEDFVDNGKYLVITNGNIQNESSIVDVSLGNRVDDLSDEIKERYYLNKNDILVTMDGTVGRTAKVVDDNMILAQRVARLVANKNTEFVYQLLNQGSFFNEMKKVSHGGTIKHISLNEISNYSATVPGNDIEQQKIGSFFKQLDDTIALHQRKLAKLKELKQGYLQNLFPKNGSKFPQLRFAGFTDAWEKRRLIDVTSISAGGDVDKDKLMADGKYPVIANALTNDGIIGYYNDYKVSAPAVTVTGRGDVGHAKARHISYTPVVRLLSIKSEAFDVNFLANLINKTKILVESTGVPQLTSPQLGSYHVQFPNMDEQVSIGRLIRHLDNLIAVNQRKVELLKKLKQAYLQKMFV